MKPMLARTYGPRFDQFPCFVQPKLNGIRALFQRAAAPGRAQGIFQSRDEKIWNTEVLQHLHDELSHTNIGDLILDGELYHHGWKLGRINGAIAVKRLEPIPDTLEIEYHIFDIVDPEVNFADRFLPIRDHFPSLPHIKIVPTFWAFDTEEIDRYFTEFVRQGYEGIMLRPNGPYEFGITPHGTEKRSKFLWKYKQWEDNEFYCLGTTPGEGKREGMIGALVLRAHPVPAEKATNDNYSFNCGTGFSDEEATEFAKNPPIGKLVRVRYPYLSEDGIPQCPSFIAVLS